jgi:phospholipid/cholesterol/gamma-HCH transport system permease protein
VKPAASPLPEDRRLSVARDPDGRVTLHLSGSWLLEAGWPSARPVEAALAERPATGLAFATAALERWDSALVTFVHAVAAIAAERGVPLALEGLPDGLRRLVSLALAVPARSQPAVVLDDALTARVGRIALRAWGTAGDALSFLGETSLALGALLRGRARFRRADLLRAFETTGVGALAIVALINLLIGAVLAFVGAVQLQPFGAAIYVANLVAIAVTRELGALMTGIVMAGRTGAAYAAVIGTMTVNEEVDALRTTGLPPVEFLVLPRVVAAALMVPALVAYADLLGLLGGMLVGVTLLGIGPEEYARQTGEALALRHVFVGLGKSVVFGVVVALTGCYYGVRCGRSAEAVGEATTKAVVMGIVLVVVADAIATVLLHAAKL